MKSPVTLLAPAGSWESLNAAISAGADAVYFGVGDLNMRARAAMNFQESELGEIVRTCHEAGVKTCLTLNNILYDEELTKMHQLCERALGAKVDSIICHDFSVIEFASRIGLPIHLSTQANVSNVSAVRYFSKFADVVVLARELSLEQIHGIHETIVSENICGPSGKLLQLEAFVHGALCVAISGKCQMSLFQYNHSANRGDCFQSCRRTYAVTDQQTGAEMVLDNDHVMSLKDLCTIACLDDLIASGISVLKIEGRGRSADYVKTVVECYREAVDAIEKNTFSSEAVAHWHERLSTVFNRGFWDGGYYLGKTGKEWSGFSGNRATLKKEQIGVVKNYYEKAEVAEIQIQSGHLKLHDQLKIIGPTSGVVEKTVNAIMMSENSVFEAKAGDLITIKLAEKVRRNDKVFLLQDRS